MKAAVLGSPIAHSLSPVLHRAAYQALGLTGWTYQAIECDAAGLPALLDGCGPDWAGLSLTMPLKLAVLGLLDQLEPLAAQVAAANTVVFADGLRHGYNTDVAGMIAALAEAAGPVPAAGPGGVLILGGGATARSALAAAGGLGTRSVTAAVRDVTRADDLLAAADRLGMRVTLIPFGDPHALPDAAPGLLISTVPAGAADAYAERIADRTLVPRCLLDVVYHPWPTPLAAAARRAGAAVAGGFALLLHQAAAQVTLMTGSAAPLEAMRAAGLAALSSRTTVTGAGQATTPER
jgi:shikimate dehydrogenase